MLIEATASDFAALIAGRGPRNLRLIDDIAPPEVLTMLGELADAIRMEFAPSAWLIVEDGAVAGLCSLTRTLQAGIIEIGYGVAPALWGRGVASRAVADLLTWAKTDGRVTAVAAETAVGNVASQKVLLANGFAHTGERTDPEDGPVITWRRDI